MPQKFRIAFMGTPEFAVPALRALHESGHEIVCVYTQPPRPKGRGQQEQISPVHACAQSLNIPVFYPASLKNLEEKTKFATLKLDLAVVAAYGLILPKAVLDAPKYGCVNIHASLLPRWRGASPIQRAIWAGDAESGVSLMQMDVGLDTGPVIAERSIKITARMTTPQLHGELSTLGAAMITPMLNDLAAHGKLKTTPQNDAEAVYASLLKKDDGRVNWNENAAAIDRQIRALNPWPGVWTEFEGARIKILEAIIPPHPTSTSVADAQQVSVSLPPLGGGQGGGAILDRHGHVICGEKTILQILKIQPPNGKPMDFVSAINGGYIAVGKAFS